MYICELHSRHPLKSFKIQTRQNGTHTCNDQQFFLVNELFLLIACKININNSKNFWTFQNVKHVMYDMHHTGELCIGFYLCNIYAICVVSIKTLLI